MLILVIFLCFSLIAVFFLIFWNIKLEGENATKIETAQNEIRALLQAEIDSWRDRYMKSESVRNGLMTDFNEKKNKWKAYCDALKLENTSLSKYRNIEDIARHSQLLKDEATAKIEEARKIIADAEERAKQILDKAENLFCARQEDCESIIRSANQYKANIENDISKLKRELEPYQPIIDAVAQSKSIVQYATEQGQDILNKAHENERTITAQAATALSESRREAEWIVSEARRKSQEILDPIQKQVEQKESRLRAIENAINGYGNEYLIPHDSLFDELAEDYSYTQAGTDLKNARERSRQIIENGNAAICDYSERNRRETAIRFVLDSFNGKVDSAQAQAKTDNFGTLQQKIIDGFEIVNANGEAFRNARISQDYMKARIDELKYAIIINEYKRQVREEQKAAREQAREEEKVRREHERAIKQAEREEKLVQKALNEAQKRFNEASAEYKEKYRLQLAELQDKLTEAEEKSKRAISEAQKTKKGHVYIISNIGSFGENVYKIGLTRRLDPVERVHELGDASVPFPFDIHAMIECEDSPSVETALHKHFVLNQMNKVNPRKEFFRLSISAIKNDVERFRERYAGDLGIKKISWTEKATAQEYRESLKRDEELANDPQKRALWEKRQFRAIEADQGDDEEDEQN